MIQNKVLKSFLVVLLMVAIVTPAHATTKQELEQTIRTLEEQYSTLYQQKQVAEYMAVNKPSSQKTPLTCTFTRPLTLGSQGADVTCLQQSLYPTYLSDKGNITGYFGALTATAVSKWQQAHKVTPSTGYFGAKSQRVYQTNGGSVATDRNFEHYRIKNGIVQYKSYDSKSYRTLASADPATFEEVTAGYETMNGYGKDKNHVYRNEEMIPVLDPNTVKIYVFDTCSYDSVVNEIFQDKHAVWTMGEGVGKWEQKWENARKLTIDVPSFSRMTCYVKDKSGVYDAEGNKVSSDTEHFTEIDGWGYAEDTEFVYYRGERIAEADPQTFEIIPSTYSPNGYSKDAHHVYWLTDVIKDADPKTFTYTSKDNSSPFARDKKAIFYRDRKLPHSIDFKTFMPITDYLIKDKNHVYEPAEIKENEISYKIVSNRDIDVATFEFLGECGSSGQGYTEQYSKDKNSVFDSSLTKMEAFDAKTFVYLAELDERDVGMAMTSSYSKDKRSVYVGCGEELVGADPATFEALDLSPFSAGGGGFGKDKHSVWYWDDKLKDADTTTFEPLGYGRYAKDIHHVYYRSNTLVGVDRDSFEHVEGDYAKDKLHVYLYGEIVEGTNPAECTSSELSGCWGQN